MATPTPEQQTIIDAFLTGQNLVIEAGAGTGKTTTLRMMAEAAPDQRGVYVAYNKAIATDAASSFPSSVVCKTAHSFAYRAVGIKYKHRLNGPRVTGRQAAGILGIHVPFQVSDEAALRPDQLARLALDTVQRFCYSADAEIAEKHVPFIPNTEGSDLKTFIAPFARKAWEDIKDKSGRLKFQHDHYLKMWAMSNPNLNADFVLLDEAQDANPVIAQVVENQNCQKIMVGDRCQAIYGWRGAVDAMSRFDADRRLVLSQSFRFGPAVAVEANKFLDLLEAPLRLTGFDQIASTVEALPTPDAVLCRTNAEAMAQAINYLAQDVTVAIVGGTNEIRMFAEGARDLMNGETPYHPDLVAFANWGEVQQYVEEDSAGADLKVFVKLIDNYGVDTILKVAGQTVNEDRADVILSTAHKAKGREWDSVRIANDFQEPQEGDELSRPELMLAYVAVTRAKKVLDNSGLTWINNWLGAIA